MKNDSLAREWDHQSLVSPGASMTMNEWRDTHSKLKTLAEAMCRLMQDTARKISGDAGLDPNLLGIHPHNAMVAKEYGEPWPDIDYNRVQMVQDLLAHQFDASRIVEAYDKAVRLDPHQRWLEANKD